MADITLRDRAFLTKLLDSGYDEEKSYQLLNEARAKNNLPAVKQSGKFAEFWSGYGKQTYNIGRQASRLAPGDQSADPNSFYNRSKKWMEGADVERQLAGQDPNSLTSAAGELAGGIAPTIPLSMVGGSLVTGALSGAARVAGTGTTLARGLTAAANVTKIPTATTPLKRLAAFGAYEGLKDQAIYDITTQGDTSLKSLALGTVSGAALVPGLSVIGKIGKNTGKYFQGAAETIPGRTGGFVNEAADRLSTKFNRIDPTKEIEFKKMTGETVGEYLNKRGVNTAGGNTVEETGNLFRKSIDEADQGLDLIAGKYKFSGKGDDFTQIALDDLTTKLDKQLSPQRGLINSLNEKYMSEGLTMTEMNQLKRLYQQNNKFGYLKEAIDPDTVARATNVLDGIRDFQFKKAAENGFKNLDEINKNTQAYKFITKELSRKLDKAIANNAISLTDWIVATGSPYGFGGVVAKKLMSSDTAKGLILKALNKGRKGVAPIAKADRESIIREQVKKVYGLSDNDYSDLSFSSTLDRKGVRTLPPPSGKPLTGSQDINVNPIAGRPPGAKYTEITPRSKIKVPESPRGKYTETPQKLLPLPRLPAGTSYPRTDVLAESLRTTAKPPTRLKTNEDVLKTLPKKKSVQKKTEPTAKKVDTELESLQQSIPMKKEFVEVPKDYTPRDGLPTGTELEPVGKVTVTKGKLPNPEIKRPQVRGFDLGVRSKMIDSLKEQGIFTDSFFAVTDKNLANKLLSYAEQKATKKGLPTTGMEPNMKNLLDIAKKGADTDLVPKEFIKNDKGIYLKFSIKDQYGNNEVIISSGYADIFFKNFEDVTFKGSNELSPVVVYSKGDIVGFVMPIKADYGFGEKIADFSLSAKESIKKPVVKETTPTPLTKDEEIQKAFQSVKDGTATEKPQALTPEKWLVKHYEDKISGIKKSVERAKSYIEKAKNDPQYARQNRKLLLDSQRYIDHWTKEGKYAEYFEANTKSLGNINSKEYGKYIREAMTRGEDVPESVLSNPEYRKIHEGQLKYLKGRNTSFANKSEMVENTEFGIKVKRQDGKPIKPEQVEEIKQSLEEFQKAHGDIQDILKKMDLTVAHTSGKNPFLTKGAGGLYHSNDKTITIGVNSALSVLLGKPKAIKAFSHELAHAIDHKAGDMTRSFSELEKHYNPTLIRKAADKMTTDRWGSISMTARKNMTPEELAKIKDKKVTLGEYYNRPNEVFARMVEQLTAYKLGGLSKVAQNTFEEYSGTVGYWTKEEFEKLAPSIEQELQRKFHNIRNPQARKEAELLLIMIGVKPSLTFNKDDIPF